MSLSISTTKPMSISSITTQHPFSPNSPPESPTYYYIPRAIPPLSLQERRQRNKAASAKYRAKKNHQYGEMRHLISSLTKENDLLLRQLDHVRRDNDRLKTTCDKLRGKILAEKILKKLFIDQNGIDQLKKFEQDIEEETWESYDH